MTAPATPTTPAAAPAAETRVPITQLDDAAMLDRLGGMPGEETETIVETPAEKPARRTVAADERAAGEEEEPAEETEEAGEEAAPEEEAAEETEETEEEAPPEKAARKLASEFTLSTPEGEDVDFDPDVLIHFEGGGQKRAMPLDRVVRLAQGGFHNETLTREVKDHRAYREKMDQTLPEVVQTIRDLADENTRLLTDPDFYLQRQTEWEESNTPEKQLERERAARKAAEDKLSQQERYETVGAFLRSDAAEAFEPLTAAIEADLISPEEINGRMFAVIDPLRGRDGIIPHTKTKEVKRLLVEQVVPWALERAEARRKKLAASAKPGPKPGEVAAAKLQRTLKRRSLTRPLALRASTASPTGAPRPGGEPSKKPARTIAEGVDSLVERLVDSVPS